jgi:UDP-N-acetylglucosamine 2-epimerase (non-hydrolysing)
MKRVLTVFGTRPEAIKLAPVALELERREGVVSRVCVTGQHRQMLDQVLGLFGIEPDLDLDVMRPNQGLAQLTANVLNSLDSVLVDEKPDLILVQGDTTTVMAAGLAAFYRGISVGHVEAGLRSGDLHSPFPEELNRRIATLVTRFHFAPTELAEQALLSEGVPSDEIFLTGNTVIDALHLILKRRPPLATTELLARAGIGANRGQRLVLATAHRRENHGARLESICAAFRDLVTRNPDLTLIYPVHLNPRVQEPVRRLLGDVPRIILTEPLEYDALAHLLQACDLVLTDSGGIQEEAPALGKPVLVMRAETERPEGIAAGTAMLVGTDRDRIVGETERLLRSRQDYDMMAQAVSPYGDGIAAQRIVDLITRGEMSQRPAAGRLDGATASSREERL